MEGCVSAEVASVTSSAGSGRRSRRSGATAVMTFEFQFIAGTDYSSDEINTVYVAAKTAVMAEGTYADFLADFPTSISVEIERGGLEDGSSAHKLLASVALLLIMQTFATELV